MNFTAGSDLLITISLEYRRTGTKTDSNQYSFTKSESGNTGAHISPLTRFVQVNPPIDMHVQTQPDEVNATCRFIYVVPSGGWIKGTVTIYKNKLKKIKKEDKVKVSSLIQFISGTFRNGIRATETELSPIYKRRTRLTLTLKFDFVTRREKHRCFLVQKLHPPPPPTSLPSDCPQWLRLSTAVPPNIFSTSLSST